MKNMRTRDILLILILLAILIYCGIRYEHIAHWPGAQ
jgi:hypothetical protein